MKKNILIGIGVVVFVVAAFFISTLADKTKVPEMLKGKHHIEISVKDYGKIQLELDADVAPITVTHFMSLVNDNYYTGTKFHRIMKGFMIQGGDNPNKQASTIKGEFGANGVENSISHERGVISMARNSYNMDSASDQFFIMHEDNQSLDGNYAAFGYVTKGMDVVDKIAEVETLEDGETVAEENQPVIEYIKEIK